MIAPTLAPPTRTPAFDIRPLTHDDVGEMLALIELTRPGPFLAGTIELGDYFGVDDDSWTYDETTMLKMSEMDEPFAHTDRNTLRRKVD